MCQGLFCTIIIVLLSIATVNIGQHWEGWHELHSFAETVRPWTANAFRPMTHYETLNISLGATDEEIRSGYRKQSRLYHPDKVPHQHAEEAKVRLAKIRKAYEVLTSDERCKYDYSLTSNSTAFVNCMVGNGEKDVERTRKLSEKLAEALKMRAEKRKQEEEERKQGGKARGKQQQKRRGRHGYEEEHYDDDDDDVANTAPGIFKAMRVWVAESTKNAVYALGEHFPATASFIIRYNIPLSISAVVLFVGLCFGL